MKKLVFAALACGALAMSAGGLAAKEWTKVRIGTEGAYPPFNYIDPNGQVQGFEIELAQAMCAAMQVECEFVVQDWDGIIPGLLAKKYDAIIASLYITDERREKMDFSQKYYQTPARFVVPKGTTLDISEAGLSGKSIAVQRGTAFERFLRDTYSKVDLRVYATQDEVNMDLVAGRIDAMLADTVAASEGFLNTPEGQGFELVGPGFSDPKWFGYGAGVATRKDDAELNRMFNAAIDKIRADGTYQRISAKFFPFDVYGQ